ncbi:hypothetical protein K1720_08470 [Thermococcus argininiproducens]|uniref:PQQ-like beta-propeller repeat protein n=1 Tax=Thermococcus argininiproducens TaxID=2866384 RepID=A0A9E7M9P9_9EURY|nr:hypothetical protein [Thermococcus argininiproducens]USG99537.1 hypothetical protein K1720_08470 [Thermococcus argininiproducens]
MKVYSFGIETVPAAGISAEDGILIIGSVRNENYKIMLLKLNYEEELEWFKLFGGKDDWEGHSIAKVNDGYLIGGAVEGIATPNGGKSWRAYLAKIDGNGNKIWERKYHILGNECVYSILPLEDGILLGGEASDDSKKGFFLMKTNENGEPLWFRTYDKWEDAVFGGIAMINDSIMLIGSSKNRNGWEIHLIRVDKEGDILEEKTLVNGVVFDVVSTEKGILLAGEHNERFYVAKLSEENEITWEKSFRNGAAIALESVKDAILVGGELNRKAVLVKISEEGEILWKKELWENGWVQVVKQGKDRLFVTGMVESEGKEYMGIEFLKEVKKLKR